MKIKLSLTILFYLFLNISCFGDVNLSTESSNPVILKDRVQKVYVKVNLEGVFIENNKKSRSPINLSVVLDKSGSMSGEKIVHAKNAARMIVQSLGKDDIFSLVLYDNSVSVLIPATKVSDKAQLTKQIDLIKADGGTALFAGVSMGLLETEKFLDSKYVNRIIVLSDGMANVGPSSTAEISELGVAASKQGISITTIGIGEGYNEDLMSNLAYKSDGSHGFAESPEQIAKLLQSEMGQILNVAGKDIIIKIICENGVRPVKVIDYEGSINKQEIIIKHNQIYHQQQKFALIELEVDEVMVRNGLLCKSTIEFIDGNSNEKLKKHAPTIVKVSTQQQDVNNHANREIFAKVFAIEAMERNRQAIQLSNQGKHLESEKLLKLNYVGIKNQQNLYNNKELEDLEQSVQILQDANGNLNFNKESKRYIEFDSKSRSGNKLEK